MIDERREEQASLYVLEALTPEERLEFEALLAQDADLQLLVASLRATRDALAGAVPPVAPPAYLKQRILAELDGREEKIVALPVKKPATDFLGFWFPWALTAAAAVICVNLYMDKGDLKEQVRRQSNRIEELDQMADALRATTNSLQQTVAGLQEVTKVADLRIALLSSLLTDSPKAVAVSLWDNQQQSGIFIVQNLKPLPPDRDYQLWVIDPKYLVPVSAGVFQVDSQGNVRISFKADKTIAQANKFAVTLESKGGAPTPTFKNMVLVGG
jgi:anti-sigma-K factor RskA